VKKNTTARLRQQSAKSKNQARSKEGGGWTKRPIRTKARTKTSKKLLQRSAARPESEHQKKGHKIPNPLSRTKDDHPTASTPQETGGEKPL